jgi:integrase
MSDKKGKRGQNEGSIRQRKDGTWEARYTFGKATDGSQKQKSVYGKTRKEVSEKLSKILNQINYGSYIDDKSTVSGWLDSWFKDYVLAMNKTSTCKGYDDIIRTHLKPHIGQFKLLDLKPIHIQEMINKIQKQTPYKAKVQIENLKKKLDDINVEDKERISIDKQIQELSKKRLSAVTINHIVVMLATSLSQAMKNGLVHQNVAKLVTKPKMEPAEIEFLSLEEHKRLLGVLHLHRLGFVFEFLLGTGLRQSEVLGLRWTDVDLNKGTIKIAQTIMRQKNFDKKIETKTSIIIDTPKTQKGKREIPLLPTLLEKLKNHQIEQEQQKAKMGHAWKDSGLVFTSDIGTNIEPRRLLYVFHSLLKAAELTQRGIHSLRHTFATRATESDVEVKTLSELLGHEDITTTLNLYVHCTQDEKRKQMQKMADIFKL